MMDRYKKRSMVRGVYSKMVGTGKKNEYKKMKDSISNISISSKSNVLVHTTVDTSIDDISLCSTSCDNAYRYKYIDTLHIENPRIDRDNRYVPLLKNKHRSKTIDKCPFSLKTNTSMKRLFFNDNGDNSYKGNRGIVRTNTVQSIHNISYNSTIPSRTDRYL